MLGRLGGLAGRRPVLTTCQRRHASTRIKSTLVGSRLPLVPIEKMDSHAGSCIPLLPEWEIVPLAYRLNKHRFHPVAVNQALKEPRAISIKYVSRAMAAAAEKGLLTFAVADSFLKAIRTIEKYRVTKVVRIKKRLTSALPKSDLLFAQDYNWYQWTQLCESLDKQASAGQPVDPLLVPPKIPSVPFGKRSQRKHMHLRVMRPEDLELIREIVARKERRRLKKLRRKERKRQMQTMDSEMQSNENEEENENESTEQEPTEQTENKEVDEAVKEAWAKSKRRASRLRNAALRRVRLNSVSPPVVPILESEIIPLLEKSKLINHPIIAFRLALIYRVNPGTRTFNRMFDEILASLSTSTKPSIVNFILHMLVRDWMPESTMKFLDRLDELNYQGDSLTQALRLSALSQHKNDNDAYMQLKSLVKETKDPTARLALLKAALISKDAKTALSTIIDVSSAVHKSSSFPLNWGQEENLWWTWVFRLCTTHLSSDLGLLTKAWRTFLEAEVPLTVSLLCDALEAFNLPPSAPQFDSLVGTKFWNHPSVIFSKIIVLARNKQYQAALKLWESSVLPQGEHMKLTVQQCRRIIALAADQPSPSVWYPALIRFIVSNKSRLKLWTYKTQMILFSALTSQPNPFYTTQMASLLSTMGSHLHWKISPMVIQRVEGLSVQFREFLLDQKNGGLLRGTNFALRSHIALFSEIIKRYVVGRTAGRSYAMSRADISRCIVDVFITPGVQAQGESLTALERILLRKLAQAEQLVQRTESFKKHLRQKLPMRQIWGVRPPHLQNPPKDTQVSSILYETVVEDFAYADPGWLSSNLKSRSLEIEVAIKNILRDRRYPAEQKSLRERSLLFYDVGVHPFQNFFLNPTMAPLPMGVVGDQYSSLWTVRFKLGDTTFVGQGARLVHALLDMSWNALSPTGSLPQALKSQTLTQDETTALIAALKHRREMDSTDNDLVMRLQRIEDAKTIAQRTADERRSTPINEL